MAAGNAQADLLAYLQGFDQQIAQQTDRERIHVTQDEASDRAACCFVALRILASSSNKVDRRVLQHLATIEHQYSHAAIEMEVLRRAGSADDYKILSGGLQGPTQEGNGPACKLGRKM